MSDRAASLTRDELAVLQNVVALLGRGVAVFSPAQQEHNLSDAVRAMDHKVRIAALETLVGYGALKREKGPVYPTTYWEIQGKAALLLREYDAWCAAEEAKRNAPVDHLEKWTRSARCNRISAALIVVVLVIGPIVGLAGGILGIIQFFRGG